MAKISKENPDCAINFLWDSDKPSGMYQTPLGIGIKNNLLTTSLKCKTLPHKSAAKK